MDINWYEYKETRVTEYPDEGVITDHTLAIRPSPDSLTFRSLGDTYALSRFTWNEEDGTISVWGNRIVKSNGRIQSTRQYLGELSF